MKEASLPNMNSLPKEPRPGGPMMVRPSSVTVRSAQGGRTVLCGLAAGRGAAVAPEQHCVVCPASACK